MLEIHADVIAEMLDHARVERPREACGLLSGQSQRIDQLHRCTNIAAGTDRFFVEPTELFHFFRSLRRLDREFLGVYHSHPETRAQPSNRDVEEFHYPQVSYWILSLEDQVPQLKCFQWVDEAFQETPFHVVDNPDGERP